MLGSRGFAALAADLFLGHDRCQLATQPFLELLHLLCLLGLVWLEVLKVDDALEAHAD